MKLTGIFLVFAMMTVIACTPSNTRSFIPGIYVNDTGGSKSKANDTLNIELAEGNNYLIHRKTGYNLISKGKIGKRQFATEEWNALYDSGTTTLKELKDGRLIIFYPQSGKLKINQREYQKLKSP